MSRQPYVYTMPESFLKDKNVPARWRVLGVINGFIINGGCFYGSNEWLMEQLACTEPTISAAFAELEKLNLVDIRRTARSRKVYRKENDPNQLGSETQVEPSHDPSQLLPNSVSNSVKEFSELEDEVRVVHVPEEETNGRSAGRIPKAEKEKLLPLMSWAERERGFNFLSSENGKQLKALSLAKENGLKAAQLKERWQDMSVDKFWSKTGFDWMNVVKSFNTKGV